MIKRGFDIIVSSLLLVVFSPLMCLVAVMIKGEDSGPVFYRGARTGKNGRPFRIYKFRTMVVDAEKRGASSTAADDHRITRTGRFIRKYKIDELPQLINVFRGEMSIVGPRPEVKHYTDMFTGEELGILSIRLGITDWASIWNADEGAVLAGAADPEQAYMELIRPTKLKLQIKYVRERSFWMDLKIIFLTLRAVVQPESQAVREMSRGLR